MLEEIVNAEPEPEPELELELEPEEPSEEELEEEDPMNKMREITRIKREPRSCILKLNHALPSATVMETRR
jgi:hypothetical protein